MAEDLIDEEIAATLQLLIDSTEHASPISGRAQPFGSCLIDVRRETAPGGMPLFLPTAMVRSLWRGGGRFGGVMNHRGLVASLLDGRM